MPEIPSSINEGLKKMKSNKRGRKMLASATRTLCFNRN